MLGYIKGRPDLHFWNYHIIRGKKFREKATHQSDWQRYRAYYRQQYVRGSTPKNIYFEIINALVPRLYFRNPAVSVTPQDGTLEGLIIGKIIEKTTNKIFRMMNLKETIQNMLHTAFYTSTSIGKFGFGGLYSPTPEHYDNLLPVDKYGDPVSFAEGIMGNFPWFMKVPTERFIVPEHTDSVGKHKWFEVLEYERSIEELKSDPMYYNTGKVVPIGDHGSKYGSVVSGPKMPRERGYIEKCLVWEVRDRRNGTVFSYSPNISITGDQGDYGEKGGVLLYFAEDSLQDEFGSCYQRFTFNRDDDHWWGVPYGKLIEPIQLEMNSIKDIKLRHMYLSVVKFLYKEGSIDVKDLKKVVSDKVGMGIPVSDKLNIQKGIQFLQAPGTPIDFIRMEQELYADLRQLVGMTRNAAGEPTVDKSHTNVSVEEIKTLQQSSNLRLDGNRDQLSDILVNIARLTHKVIFEHWNQDMVANIAGEDKVPLWVAFRGEMLAGTRFKLTVDPDSALPQTRDMKQQEAMRLFQMLMQSPHANQEALVRKMLQEHVGTDYEQYMAMQPQFAPQQAMGIGQTAQNIAGLPPQLLADQMGMVA